MIRHIPLLPLPHGYHLVLWLPRCGGLWLLVEWPGVVRVPSLGGGPGWRRVRGIGRRVLWGVRR